MSATSERERPAGDRLLVVGSYPPIPLPSCAATLEAVRRGWDDGREVTVVSHRSSAADLAVPVIGPLAGHRLERVRRLTGATRLVLIVEDGAPVPPGPAVLQSLSARELARSLRRFDHVTLVVVGDPPIAQASLETMRACSDEVLYRTPAGSAPAGVTVAGPVEHNALERSRSTASRAARKVLGPRAPTLRASLARHGRSVRDAVSRI